MPLCQSTLPRELQLGNTRCQGALSDGRSACSLQVSSLPSADSPRPSLSCSARLVSAAWTKGLNVTLTVSQPTSLRSAPPLAPDSCLTNSRHVGRSTCSGKSSSCAIERSLTNPRSIICVTGYIILICVHPRNAGPCYFAVFLTTMGAGPMIATTIAWTGNTWGNHCKP